MEALNLLITSGLSGAGDAGAVLAHQTLAYSLCCLYGSCAAILADAGGQTCGSSRVWPTFKRKPRCWSNSFLYIDCVNN